jgi:hypothetical protein
MRTTPVLILLLALAGCAGNGASATDAGLDAGDTDTGDPIPLTAVDMLVMVDASDSMYLERPLLANALFSFVSSIVTPLPDASFAAIDDLRIAVVTSNMGFSSDGTDNAVYWPGAPDLVPATCAGFGDDGAFQEIEVASIELADGGTIDCPELPDASAWAETTPDSPNADLAAQAACLVVRDYGCDWVQPLASIARGLTREDQASFVRDDGLLVLLAVTDSDDCSLQDGQAMFTEEEIADQALKEVNLACGEHPEHLFAPSHFYEAFTAARGRADAVVFAAIAGVPYADQPGAAACVGYGDQLDGCLEQDEMQYVPEESIVGWYARPACERAQDSVTITSARPGRRFVELATGFGANGYVYSICNEDWTPAFDALAAMIAGKLEP